jgi:hypothetical protein
MLGVILTNAPLRAIEISRTGCLLESSRQIEPGTAGKLRLEIEGRTYSEEVRVTRCQRLEGAGPIYRLGVEFLLTRRPSSSSLRLAVNSIVEAKEHGAKRNFQEGAANEDFPRSVGSGRGRTGSD